MKKIIFKSLTVLSQDKKFGNSFIFTSQINFIASEHNSAGKTTLIQLIYSALGCEAKFKKEWEKCYLCLEILIDSDLFKLYRTPNDRYCIINLNNKVQYYSNQSEYHAALSKILGYSILLTDQRQNLKQARPIHFFATSYIAQGDWNSFFEPKSAVNGLTEFNKNYKTALVNQFTNIQNNEEKEISIKIDEIKKEKNQNINTKLSLKQIQKNLNIKDSLFSLEELKNISTQYERELNILQQNLSNLLVEKQYLQNEIEFAKLSATELAEDYEFSRTQTTELECPYCGTLHSNSIVEKSHLFFTKNNVDKYLKNKENELREKKNQIKKIENEIYTLKSLEKEPYISKIIHNNIDNIKKSILFNTIDETVSNLESQFNQLDINLKLAKSNKTQIQKENKENIKEINNYFISQLRYYADKLSIELEWQNIKKVIDFNKIVKEVKGGHADNNRSVLAYYLAIYDTAIFAKTDSLPPMVIDTPNQNDQDKDNYTAILKTISDFKDRQILVCLISNRIEYLGTLEVNIIRVNRIMKPVNQNILDIFDILFQ